MLVHLKRAVHLAGKDYPRGVHELPESLKEDKHFLKLVNAGLACDPDDSRRVSTESPAARNARLADRIAAEAAAKRLERENAALKARNDELEAQLAAKSDVGAESVVVPPEHTTVSPPADPSEKSPEPSADPVAPGQVQPESKPKDQHGHKDHKHKNKHK